MDHSSLYSYDRYYNAYSKGEDFFHYVNSVRVRMERNQVLKSMKLENRKKLFEDAYLDLENAINAKRNTDALLAELAGNVLQQVRENQTDLFADDAQHCLLTTLHRTTKLLNTSMLADDGKVNPEYIKAAKDCGKSAKKLHTKGRYDALGGALCLLMSLAMTAICVVASLVLVSLDMTPVVLSPIFAVNLMMYAAPAMMFHSCYQRHRLANQVNNMTHEASVKFDGKRK